MVPKPNEPQLVATALDAVDGIFTDTSLTPEETLERLDTIQARCTEHIARLRRQIRVWSKAIRKHELANL